MQCSAYHTSQPSISKLQRHTSISLNQAEIALNFSLSLADCCLNHRTATIVSEDHSEDLSIFSQIILSCKTTPCLFASYQLQSQPQNRNYCIRRFTDTKFQSISLPIFANCNFSIKYSFTMLQNSHDIRIVLGQFFIF